MIKIIKLSKEEIKRRKQENGKKIIRINNDVEVVRIGKRPCFSQEKGWVKAPVYDVYWRGKKVLSEKYIEETLFDKKWEVAYEVIPFDILGRSLPAVIFFSYEDAKKAFEKAYLRRGESIYLYLSLPFCSVLLENQIMR